MEKKFNFLNNLSFFLILFSIFFWDLRFIPETQEVEKNISSLILSNLDIRFLYLISIIPLFYYLKTYIKKKLISLNFIYFSILILIFFLIHQIFTSRGNLDYLEILYVIIIFITLLISKVFGKYFLDNKIIIIKFVIFLSIIFYIFSLILFDFLNIKNSDGQFLTWNNFNFTPCKSGFFNNYDFIFSESSHFGMIAISIFLTNFYYVIKTNYRDKSLIISFIIFSFIIFNNMSLTVIVGIISCQFALIVANLRKENFKYILSSILMIIFFVILMFNFDSCKWKFKNAIWLIQQKIPILKINLEEMTEFQKKEINEYQGLTYNLRVNSKNKDIFKKDFLLTKATDLSSAVLGHNLRITQESIFDRPFGWGINRYDDAFEYYTKYKIKNINHTYAIYVNNEDGSLNLTKIIVEFGIFSIFLVVIFTIFIFSKKIPLSDKIFLFPFVFVQVFLRGAGYFNGGFLIVSILIILITFNLYDRKISEKSY